MAAREVPADIANWCALHSIEIAVETIDHGEFMVLRHPRFRSIFRGKHGFYTYRDLAMLQGSMRGMYEWLR